MQNTGREQRMLACVTPLCEHKPPLPPFDLVGVEQARYGEPKHETAPTPSNSLYGPPQHETNIEDPEWLISIAAKAFSVKAAEPAGMPTSDEQKAEPPERERTVVRL